MPTPGPNSNWRNGGFIAAGLLSLLAAAFHVIFFLQVGGFWRDEVNLINLAVRSPLRDAARDSFPILMPLLVRAWSWVDLAQTDTGLRCLGMIIGLSLLAALWLGLPAFAQGAVLSATTALLPAGTNVNLTADGKLD